MSKKAIPFALSHSFRPFSNRYLPPNQTFSRPKTLSLSTRFITTDVDSDVDGARHLEGLIDPTLDFPGHNWAFQGLSISAEDITSLLGSAAADSTSTSQSHNSSECSKDAIFIANTITNCNDGFGEQTQKFLRQFRGKLDKYLVVDVLRSIQNAELGVKFFIWAGRQIGYSHAMPVYNALLDLVGCDRNEKIPESFLREIGDDSDETLGKLLNVLIRKYCQKGYWNVALEELGRIKDLGYKPTRVTYDALVQVFLEADRLDTARLVRREMSDLGFQMNRYTLGCFVRSLCKARRLQEAIDLIEKEDFEPDTVIYTQMISGLCEASLFEEAMDILNRMRSSSCIPNVVTYRVLLCGCLNKGKLGRCKRILSMMIPEGCYPSSKIFNSLVHAYCKSGDYAYAYKLLKKMVSCNCVPGYIVYNILIGGICGNNDTPGSDVLELAEKAYSEMLNAGLVLNKVNVSNFARCLCKAGKFDQAYDVIHEMMSKGFIPDVSTYSNVIEILCNASKVDKAFLLFQEMKRNGLVPDVYTYTILIDNFCKAGLIQQAQGWFDEMVRDGCAPNVVTYTALIHAYLKARNVSKANELFEMMLSEECIPNVVTFTALIDGHCKAGEIEKACQIYGRMRGMEVVPDIDVYFKNDGSNNTEPNVVTYGALVDGLCKAHRVEEAHNLLDSMFIEGCEPNHIVYDALIDGFCKAGKLDEAQGVFVKMSERGYQPNVYTYSSLIDRLFKDKRLDLALKVLSRMLENSCAPNVVVYTEMIDGLCKVGKTDEAYKLMLMMEEKGCNPNVVTYTAMMDGFGRMGKVEKSLELLKQMSAKACAPNYVTYRVLIKYCCATGLLDEAHQLLVEMKQTYWPKHMASYQKVIEGFNREFIVSLGIVDELSQNESMPILPVYRLLIDCFRKARRFEVALELYNEILPSFQFSSKDVIMHSSLIECLSFLGKVDKAFELYVNMTNRGGVPELGVIFNLIKGLIKVNKWEEALMFSRSLCHMDIHWHSIENTAEGQ